MGTEGGQRGPEQLFLLLIPAEELGPLPLTLGSCLAEGGGGGGCDQGRGLEVVNHFGVLGLRQLPHANHPSELLKV